MERAAPNPLELVAYGEVPGQMPVTAEYQQSHHWPALLVLQLPARVAAQSVLISFC